MRHALLASLLLALAACPKDDEDTGDTDTDSDTDSDTEPADVCVPAVFDDGDSGTYTINSAGDDHVKHHFDMPAGVTYLIAHATWTTTEWKMLLDVGVGFCPHSGTSYAQVDGEGGELELELSAMDAFGAETFEEGDQWFVHVGEDMPVNPEDGETSDYALSVELCSPPAAE